MNSVVLHGMITEDGKLVIDLPAGLPVGPVEVEIRPPFLEGFGSEMLAASVLIGMWADHPETNDPVIYGAELRRRAGRRGQ